MFTGEEPRKSRKGGSGILTLLRVILLDSPVVIVVGALMFLWWVNHVQEHYLLPQLEAAEWTTERSSETDLTYYTRPCFKEDMSTMNGEDLFLPDSATPQQAYEHQLRHGFTVFPKVLSDETARNLRKHFDERNRNLTEQESNYVIAGENRYSFNPGMEDPAVSKAMEELTNNKRLKDSVEKIMGRNPALIEMTAITSSYGATSQTWHDDVIPEASPVQFARAFGPSYSIFVVLQNTTKAMGATQACPGLHMCAAGRLAEVCEENGFQLVGEHGYWRAGDALLMNMNSWHRGTAHTDPYAPDRVMLILTWVPRPRSRAESRQLSQGITFSLKWNMWGHTWNDMRQASTAMSQPWATLRALGLYKKPTAEWGIDYVTSATMRMANEDNGFRPDELVEFVHSYGGFKFLPSWLHGYVGKDEETAWSEFLLDTLGRCEAFVTIIAYHLVGGYAALYFFIGLFSTGKHGNVKQGMRHFAWALFRLGIMVGTLFALWKAGIRHVDNTQWASDIRHGLRYTSPFGNEESRYDGPTVFPHRNDVLIESRFKSDYLAMYSDYVSNHPGNRIWNELVDEKAPTYASYSGLSSHFRRAVAQYIVLNTYKEAGRFLYQNKDGDFVKMTTSDAISETERELLKRSNSIRAIVLTQLDYLISDARYGPLRKSKMSSKHAVPFLTSLQSQLQHVPNAVLPLITHKQKSAHRRQVKLTVGKYFSSPYAYLQSGKIVQVKLGKRGSDAYWYMAEIDDVYSTGDVTVVIVDSGNKVDTHNQKIKPYVAPSEGEQVQVKSGKWKQGTIVGYNESNDLFEVQVDGEIMKDVRAASIRRKA